MRRSVKQKKDRSEWFLIFSATDDKMTFLNPSIVNSDDRGGPSAKRCSLGLVMIIITMHAAVVGIGATVIIVLIINLAIERGHSERGPPSIHTLVSSSFSLRRVIRFSHCSHVIIVIIISFPFSDGYTTLLQRSWDNPTRTI